MIDKPQFLWHEVQGVEASMFGRLAKEAEQKYGDLLMMPHPVSKKHTPLSEASRAAQFAPFAALTGYDDAVEHTAEDVTRQMNSIETEEIIDI